MAKAKKKAKPRPVPRVKVSKEERERQHESAAIALLTARGHVVMKAAELGGLDDDLRREEFLRTFREMRDESEKPRWKGALFDEWQRQIAVQVAVGEGWALKWYGEQMIGKPGTRYQFTLRSPEVMEMAIAAARDVLARRGMDLALLQEIITEFQHKMTVRAAVIEGE